MNGLIRNREGSATLAMFLVLTLLIVSPVKANLVPVTWDYDSVALSGGSQSGHFPQEWDLTACDLTISLIYDANGLVDEFGGNAHAWAQLGVRTLAYGDFNPTWDVEGAGVWLATDYDWAQNTFAPDPVGAPKQDLDDKMILQKAGGHGEGDYNLPSTPPDPWANYGVWFDRDGVDEWQANMWGMINGATYNTGGLYTVVMTLHATGPAAGTAYMTVNGVNQGFYTTWKDAPPDLYPAGMIFTGDMAHMQVFYGLFGYGPTVHSVLFQQISATGCLYWTEVSIDIKPGSDPNSINLKSKGVVPVAVVTTGDFNAATINPDTVRLAGASPVRWTMEDVDGDGDLDMLFHFRTQDLNLDKTSTSATLTADTFDGLHIRGTDSVNIVPK